MYQLICFRLDDSDLASRTVFIVGVLGTLVEALQGQQTD
jgi:hypothetical protein